jgi:hypothetical protein
MAQIFNPSTNTLAKFTIFAAVFILAGIAWTIGALARSSYTTGQGVTRTQPIQFSHDHHARGLGIDCRYCHTSVEVSAFAGIPPTATCMHCHQIIWADAPELAPVRESFRTGRPLRWRRVHDLPDYAYFDHSVHVAKGVGCASCHGRVDRMPLMQQASSLQMEWCLDCHRNPQAFVRPKSEVFNMSYAPADQEEEGARLVREHGIQSAYHLTNCSVCHR